MSAIFGHLPCHSYPYCWLPGKLVLCSGPPRAILQEPTSCFLSQYWYRLWERGAEATEDLARRARINLSLAEVQRMKTGYSPGMGNSRRACLREMHGWADRCVGLPYSRNRIPRVSGVRRMRGNVLGTARHSCPSFSQRPLPEHVAAPLHFAWLMFS